MGYFRRFQKLGLAVFLIFMAGMFGILSPYFFTWDNIANILVQSSVPIITATGMTLVIATAGIDLSVGAILALSSILMAWAMKSGLGVMPSVALGILSGASMGVLNGIGTAKLGVSPFMITLGTAGIFRALALILTEARPIYGMPLSFRMLAIDRLGPVPLCVLLSLAVAFAMYLILMWTGFGTNARAVGSNPEGAYRMGIPVKRTLTAVYAFSGGIAALSGVIVTARLNTAEAIAGFGIELEAIAAVVMGGTSFFGGEASIGGTVLGGLLIGTLGNGLTLINVPSYYQQLVIGLVFILAVLADRIRREKMLVIKSKLG
jgi:ribose/xylose/arabinose/galactoside ABC-type transport system permease subunit